MRALDKGTAPNTYKKYQDSKSDLFARLGSYCAYCEKQISDLGYVDHVHPLNHGGAKLDWANFLPSCYFCNRNKWDNNTSRVGFLWPDIDNTDLAYDYDEISVITPKATLNAAQNAAAQALITLTGLDKTVVNSTKKDTRWSTRNEAWNKAKSMHAAWSSAPNQPGLLIAIPEIAKATGYYSIWCKTFATIPPVLAAIELAFNMGRYNLHDATGQRIIRNNALI